ncbi:MAG TPA: hypothetical protein VM076_21735 [Gemmatimonadaceae bacterium]|nr:hypothetical protein [Gemmatimonadaceae bacterium]
MLILFRLIHILAGAFWVGTAIFTVLFLLPTVRALGPGAGPVMQQMTQVRKLPLWFLGASVLTVLSGIGLYSRASGGFSNQWMHSGPGRTFGIGAAFAILAVIVGMGVTSPTAKRVAALGQSMASAGKPPTPDQQAEMGRLQAKLGKASVLATALVVCATIAMAVARYIP